MFRFFQFYLYYLYVFFMHSTILIKMYFLSGPISESVFIQKGIQELG